MYKSSQEQFFQKSVKQIQGILGLTFDDAKKGLESYRPDEYRSVIRDLEDVFEELVEHEISDEELSEILGDFGF